MSATETRIEKRINAVKLEFQKMLGDSPRLVLVHSTTVEKYADEIIRIKKEVNQQFGNIDDLVATYCIDLSMDNFINMLNDICYLWNRLGQKVLANLEKVQFAVHTLNFMFLQLVLHPSFIDKVLKSSIAELRKLLRICIENAEHTNLEIFFDVLVKNTTPGSEQRKNIIQVMNTIHYEMVIIADIFPDRARYRIRVDSLKKNPHFSYEESKQLALPSSLEEYRVMRKIKEASLNKTHKYLVFIQKHGYEYSSKYADKINQLLEAITSAATLSVINFIIRKLKKDNPVLNPTQKELIKALKDIFDIRVVFLDVADKSFKIKEKIQAVIRGKPHKFAAKYPVEFKLHVNRFIENIKNKIAVFNNAFNIFNEQVRGEFAHSKQDALEAIKENLDKFKAVVEKELKELIELYESPAFQEYISKKNAENHDKRDSALRVEETPLKRRRYIQDSLECELDINMLSLLPTVFDPLIIRFKVLRAPNVKVPSEYASKKDRKSINGMWGKVEKRLNHELDKYVEKINALPKSKYLGEISKAIHMMVALRHRIDQHIIGFLSKDKIYERNAILEYYLDTFKARLLIPLATFEKRFVEVATVLHFQIEKRSEGAPLLRLHGREEHPTEQYTYDVSAGGGGAGGGGAGGGGAGGGGAGGGGAGGGGAGEEHAFDASGLNTENLVKPCVDMLDRKDLELLANLRSGIMREVNNTLFMTVMSKIGFYIHPTSKRHFMIKGKIFADDRDPVAILYAVGHKSGTKPGMIVNKAALVGIKKLLLNSGVSRLIEICNHKISSSDVTMRM